MLKGGITCFNDMYFYPEAAAAAASEFGMRAVLGITALEFPTPYASDAADYLNKGLAVREQWRGHPLISFCLAPHAPYTVSDKYFRAHPDTLGTTQPADPLPHPRDPAGNRRQPRRAVRQSARWNDLSKLGLLGPNFIGVHAVHLQTTPTCNCSPTPASSIAHCPTSNLKLASGFAPVAKMRQLGINVGSGTDGAASNNRLDLFGEMRMASLLAKGLTGDASALPAHEILRMATLNAANALGLGQQTGSITPGKAGRLCAVSLGELECHPCYDPVSHLINVTGRESVTHVWVAGKCCVDNKTLRYDKLNDLEAASRYGKIVWNSAGQPESGLEQTEAG
jgi:5-methylthioadenosine/S-adenosylhomocysteine deaminase